MQKLKQNWKSLPFIFLILVTIWLRFANLGYSDYQGDEIKALFLPSPGQPVSEFLLTQRKGPVQFIITFAYRFLNQTYTNRLLLRFPFALAGMLSVLVFYKFVKIHFGKKVAFYASFFVATNGFIVAFSRIVQYQSFVILFMILAIYMFSLASLEKKWQIKGLYLGFIFWAISVLSHYDGVLIAPFVIYLLYNSYKLSLEKNNLKYVIPHFIVSGFIFVALLASFYIPFVFAISKATKDYWQNRLSGGGGKVSSSQYLFQAYQPIYVIHIYKALGIIGILAGVYPFIKNKFKFSKFVSFLPTYPRIVFIFLLFWVALPLAFFEAIVNIPGTHIFNYLIPATILLGIGIVSIENLVFTLYGKSIGKIINIVGIVIIFVFIFLQTHTIFVDHSKEYPWESERFLFWELHQPSPVFHLSMFGFPYYRHWDEIGSFVRNSENNGYYSTNERKSIARYHIPFEKDSDEAGHFVHIINPQSFTNEILSEKANYWAQKYEPVLVFFKDGKENVKVYYMPKGSLEEIQAQGY